MSNYYLGSSPENVLGDTPRYFYALRKNENGSLYFLKNDNLKPVHLLKLTKLEI